MFVVIDNYDSFTYNLVQYLGELGAELKVFRNDKCTFPELESLHPEGIVISPGPGRPENAGISVSLIQEFDAATPILGVCLGHQALAQAFGGNIIPAPVLMHGKTSDIYHDKQGVFRNLPNPFEATRYHSLIVERATLPDCLSITAETGDGIIMGLRHASKPLYGIQFHPESILTSAGKDLLKNFLRICQHKMREES